MYIKKLKKWLVKILKNILKKLEPSIFEEVIIKHSYQPLITIEANCSFDKRDADRMSEERVKEILARRLGEQITDHMGILTTISYEPFLFEEQIHYRAKIQIVDNRS